VCHLFQPRIARVPKVGIWTQRTSGIRIARWLFEKMLNK
jgi:hypothetical protein